MLAFDRVSNILEVQDEWWRRSEGTRSSTQHPYSKVPVHHGAAGAESSSLALSGSQTVNAELDKLKKLLHALESWTGATTRGANLLTGTIGYILFAQHSQFSSI